MGVVNRIMPFRFVGFWLAASSARVHPRSRDQSATALAFRPNGESMLNSLPTASSAHIEIHGEIDDPVVMIDLMHLMASMDVGTSHGGFTSEGDITQCLSRWHLERVPGSLFMPAGRTSAIMEKLLPALAEAGFSSRTVIYRETPAGYRYGDPDSLRHLVLTGPDMDVPFTHPMSGDEPIVTLSVAEDAITSVERRTELMALRETTSPIEGACVLLGPRMLKWLGMDPAPQMPRPTPSFQ
jgi:hypothetical protein